MSKARFILPANAKRMLMSQIIRSSSNLLNSLVNIVAKRGFRRKICIAFAGSMKRALHVLVFDALHVEGCFGVYI